MNFLFPFMAKLPTQYNRKMDDSFNKMDELFFSIIKKHRERTQESHNQEDLDLLDHIISLDESGELSNAEVYLTCCYYFFCL